MARKSRQKDAILRVLRSTTSHPTADWIFQEVRKEMPNISLGTVYRNLKLLAERGEILELRFNDSPSQFDANTQEHCHVKCERCHRVFDVGAPIDKKLSDSISRKTGFKVLGKHLELRGLCPECQKIEG